MVSSETGRNPDRFSSRAKRFMEIMTIAVGILSTSDVAASQREYSDIDQLSGKNFEEREQEIKKLERECAQIRDIIKKLEDRIEDSRRYANSPGLRAAERLDLREKQGDLRRKEVAIGILKKGKEAGHERTDREIERREGWKDLADRTGLEVLDPTLDLSPEHLDNREVAKYYKEYQVGFADHALVFQLEGMDPYESRGMLAIGPEFTGAHFFINKGGRELRVVFDLAQGGHSTLVLDEGNGTYLPRSDAHGKSLPVDSDE